jgi:hypothetical protein
MANSFLEHALEIAEGRLPALTVIRRTTTPERSSTFRCFVIKATLMPDPPSDRPSVANYLTAGLTSWAVLKASMVRLGGPRQELFGRVLLGAGRASRPVRVATSVRIASPAKASESSERLAADGSPAPQASVTTTGITPRSAL